MLFLNMLCNFASPWKILPDRLNFEKTLKSIWDHLLGTGHATKWDEILEEFQGVSFSNLKFILQILDLFTGLFSDLFAKKIAI